MSNRDMLSEEAKEIVNALAAIGIDSFLGLLYRGDKPHIVYHQVPAKSARDFAVRILEDIGRGLERQGSNSSGQSGSDKNN